MQSNLARLAAATLVAASTLSAWAQGGAGTLVVGYGAVPRHLNSAVQSGVATGIPAAQIFASPLRFDDGWTPQPYLAESWVFQDDGRSLLLKLRNDVLNVSAVPLTTSTTTLTIDQLM